MITSFGRLSLAAVSRVSRGLSLLSLTHIGHCPIMALPCLFKGFYSVQNQYQSNRTPTQEEAGSACSNQYKSRNRRKVEHQKADENTPPDIRLSDVDGCPAGVCLRRSNRRHVVSSAHPDTSYALGTVDDSCEQHSPWHSQVSPQISELEARRPGAAG
jgi:hypothetical protein